MLRGFAQISASEAQLLDQLVTVTRLIAREARS
jgi:hypothetical protein